MTYSALKVAAVALGTVFMTVTASALPLAPPPTNVPGGVERLDSKVEPVRDRRYKHYPRYRSVYYRPFRYGSPYRYGYRYRYLAPYPYGYGYAYPYAYPLYPYGYPYGPRFGFGFSVR
jgi:hypothetical protein